jgi:hypothetical protein
MNTSAYTNTSTLPPYIFELKHDDFYDFVDHECGTIQAQILKFQLISDVDIFIECDDPTEILKYNSAKLNELKANSCLMIDEKTCIILPGILSSFSSLKKRLLKKMDEHMKELKRNKNVVNSYASTPLTANTTSQSKTVDELRSHIIKSIDQWIDKYRNDFDLQADSSLVESVDYKIVFKDNVIDQSPVVISCTCGSKSSLSRHASNGYYQVS